MSSRLVTWFSPRVVVIAGGILVLVAILCGSTLNRGVPYFPNLVLPIVIGGIGLGLIGVPLSLALIASVDVDRIGPASAVSVMLRSLGGPLVLAVVQIAITSRTLHLGGTTGPVKAMDAVQLHALDHGYTFGLLWLAGVVILLCGVALFIDYTAQQVAVAQKVKKPSTPRDSSSGTGRFVSRSAQSGRTQPACSQPAHAERAWCSRRPVGRPGRG